MGEVTPGLRGMNRESTVAMDVALAGVFRASAGLKLTLHKMHQTVAEPLGGRSVEEYQRAVQAALSDVMEAERFLTEAREHESCALYEYHADLEAAAFPASAQHLAQQQQQAEAEPQTVNGTSSTNRNRQAREGIVDPVARIESKVEAIDAQVQQCTTELDVCKANVEQCLMLMQQCLMISKPGVTP